MPSTRQSAMSRLAPRGSPSLERIRPREGERAGSSCEAAFSTVRVHVLQLPYLFDRVQGAPINRSIIALAAALAASSALAAQDALSSWPVRELARRSFWAAKLSCSVSAAGCCRFFRTPGRCRPAGRLLRRARFAHLSQYGGGQAGACQVRSRSRRRAAVAARRGPVRRVRERGPVNRL